tara:strand:- start:226 stop:540 length:315 start_codon:yes stop_codon:yes gene_type:complete
MTEFWADDTLITGRKALQTRKAVTLIEALLGFPSTGNTKDSAREGKRDALTHQHIHIDRAASDRQFIAHRSIQLRAHLFNRPSHPSGINPLTRKPGLIRHQIHQ